VKSRIKNATKSSPSQINSENITNNLIKIGTKRRSVKERSRKPRKIGTSRKNSNGAIKNATKLV
jgi:hypothetical protein